MKRKDREDLQNLRIRHKYLVQAIRALEKVQSWRLVEDPGHDMAKLLAVGIAERPSESGWDRDD